MLDHPTIRDLAAYIASSTPAVAIGRGGCAAAAAVAAAPAMSLDAVAGVAERTLGSRIDVDTPLMDGGADSLALVELRSALQQEVGEAVSLPSMVMLDHPTIRDLAAYIASFAPVAEPRLAMCDSPAATHSFPGIIGQSAVWPAGVDTAFARWDMTATASDLVSEIPVSRFGVGYTALFSDAIVGATFGATLRGAELFDHLAFKLAVAEAKVMDPQQRLLR